MGKVLYFGGDILTMEKNLYAEAVLVEDGMITKVGGKELLLSEKDAESINLQGKTLLPAFIDSHSHITAYANTLAFADLSSAENFEEIKSLLTSFLEKKSVNKDSFVVGFGYDQNALGEKKHPNKFLLDQVSSDLPVLIVHKSGHMAVVNTKALEIANITSETLDPSGGHIGRISDTKEPSGYLEEKAFMALSSLFPSEKGNVFELLKQAEHSYLSYGITTVQEGLVAEEQFSLLKDADLSIDVIGYVDICNAKQLFLENSRYAENYVGHFKLGGYKLFLDGSPQGRTAWMTKPYEKTYAGYPIYDDKTVLSYVKASLSENVQLLTHCNGDAAAAQLISSFQKAYSETKLKNDIRPVMIHAQLVRKDQLPFMKQLKIIPSYFVAHTYFWGDVHRENFGDRAYEISPAASTLALSMPYTFHQDTPVLPPDMLFTVWCAVNRISKSGTVMGEDQRISPLDALKGVTINAAYQYFEDNKKGSIAEGKLADLVILSENPLKCDPMKIKDIEVLETIKQGKTLFKKE